MAISDYMYDLATQMGGVQNVVPKHTTNKKAGQALEMDDFLKLMVTMLQNQSMDNTADTSEMMNQMVQMSVVQAITDISTLISDSTSLTYAASLVGKEVTIGKFDAKNQLQETVGTVTGTGVLNGQQVIFIGEDCYNLSDILAIGRLPEENRDEEAAEEAQAVRAESEELPETEEDWEELPVETPEEQAESFAEYEGFNYTNEEAYFPTEELVEVG